METESGKAISETRSRALTWAQQLGELRHDLRNPLSEILGFTEMMVEEAEERNLESLVGGLESIRKSANRILADINHVLNPNIPGLGADVLGNLKQTIEQQTDGIMVSARDLSAQCDALQQTSLGDDLARVSESARRLRAFAPPALEGLNGLNSATGAAPATGGSRSPAEERPRDSGSIFPAGLGGTLLVVDDQEANLALLSRRLGKRGYTVVTADSGRQAMELLRARRFDLILLDIVMPGMDGMEFLRQVKADRELAHIPVVMLSALDELDSVVRCIELGADDYLPKPFPSAILNARVDACLANKRMSDKLRKYTSWLFGKTLFSSAVAAPQSLNLRLQQRTVLFADIRGFTQWSEGNSPEAAVAMLNRYFETAEKISENSSVIKSEYIGDEIMGVFPTAVEAVRIAQALRLELGPTLNEWGLGVGIGVYTGPVIEGLMGGAEVKAYRFTGDTVNTAKRICTDARAGEVLMGETTRAEVFSLVRLGAASDITVKGKAAPLKVWPLLEPAS